MSLGSPGLKKKKRGKYVWICKQKKWQTCVYYCSNINFYKGLIVMYTLPSWKQQN